MRENKYQSELIGRVRKLLPDCVVLKNDSSYLQGVPDLLVLNGKRWAALEVKASADAGFQPNQEHYIKKMDGMSFAAVIHPDNEQDVLNALQQSL